MPVSDNLVKKPNTLQTYTEEHIQDIIKCMDDASGYMHFAKHFAYIQHPVKGRLLFNPYEFQKRLLKGYNEYDQIICMLPRQSGKCLDKDTLIKIKNKETGEEHEISIGDFYNMQSSKGDQ